jgi:phosphohistidine swiveling domain-containing protein
MGDGTKEQVGGKAAGLLALEAAGAQVPSFSVVGSDAFERHLRAWGLRDSVDGELATLSGAADSPEFPLLAERCGAAIGARIMAGTLDEPLLSQLESWVTKWGDDPLAVRSSMVGEDSDGASFAGQLESFLYCRGLESVALALKQCWASAFGGRVLVYRQRHDGCLPCPQMGIVVQRMITGDCSGVLFTAHPVTGRRDQGLITAAWGLGEGVVSGVCNTDEYTWQHGSGEVAAQLADKDIALRADASGRPGTVEVDVSEELRSARCMSAAEVAQLGAEALRLAEDFGCPLDIEWTREDGAFWILQARPITSLPEAPNLDGPELVFDNSNIQESYCGVTTPLTFSFASEAYASVYEQTMRAVRIPQDVITAHRLMLRNLLGLVRGRVYYNISNWYRGLLLLPSFGRNKEDMEAMMGLEDPVDLVRGEVLSLPEKLRRLPGLLRTLVALKSQFRGLEASVPQFLADFGKAYSVVDRAALPSASYSRCMELLEHLRTSMLDRWHVPIINDFYVMMTTGALRRALGEESDDLFTALLSGEEGIESTEPTKMLLRMAASARAKDGLADALRAAAAMNTPALPEGSYPEFDAQIADYIERYGDRCMGELKLETVSLREDPSFLFDVLVSFLDRPDLDPADLVRREREFRSTGERGVRESFGWWGRRKVRKALGAARESVKNRENMRLARTRMFGLYRDVYFRLGEVLAAAGRLGTARDVFYLTTDELRAYHEGRSVNADLGGVARARRSEFAGYESEDLPHQFRTRGPVYHGNRYVGPDRPAIDGDARVLQGTGCYPGIVEAPLRVILSPKDALDVGGRILCTVRTDPGWAPLFPSSAGILVERGSTLSHSAVVARELGIPAVVGVPGLLEIVADGELVRLDGASGRVERLSCGAGEQSDDEAPPPSGTS